MNTALFVIFMNNYITITNCIICLKHNLYMLKRYVIILLLFNAFLI